MFEFYSFSNFDFHYVFPFRNQNIKNISEADPTYFADYSVALVNIFVYCKWGESELHFLGFFLFSHVLYAFIC